MGVTIPDNIYFPDVGNAVAPLEAHMAEQAESVQQALDRVRAGTAPAVANQSERQALFPNPLQGAAVWRLDRGYEERYYAEYSSTGNPGGATPAGWYPAGGALPFAAIYRSTSAINLSPNDWQGVWQNQYWSGGTRGADFKAYNGGWEVPFTGLWEVQGSVTMVSNVSVMLSFSLNSTTMTTASQLLSAQAASAGGAASPTVKSEVVLQGGDILRAHILHQNPGVAAWATTGTGVRPELNGRMSVRWLGPAR